jgi:hypothetical protein
VATEPRREPRIRENHIRYLGGKLAQALSTCRPSTHSRAFANRTVVYPGLFVFSRPLCAKHHMPTLSRLKQVDHDVDNDDDERISLASGQLSE